MDIEKYQNITKLETKNEHLETERRKLQVERDAVLQETLSLKDTIMKLEAHNGHLKDTIMKL